MIPPCLHPWRLGVILMALSSRDAGSGGFSAEALALGFWPHFCSHGRQCGCEICRYGCVGRARHSHCQRNNTADGADGKPCPTALLPEDEEENGTI